MGSPLTTKKKKGPTKSRASAAKEAPRGRVTPAAPKGVPYHFENGISFPRSTAPRPTDRRPGGTIKGLTVVNCGTAVLNNGMNLDIDGLDIVDCDNGYVQLSGSTNAKNVRITDTRS